MAKKFILYLFVISLLITLLYPACMYQQAHKASTQNIQTLTYWTAKTDDTPKERIIQLPYTFEHLAPRTPITLTKTVLHPGSFICIKSVYAPFRLYADDALIYESGQPDSYPAFFQDPPTLTKIIPLPADTDESMNLRLEYQSPKQRSELRLPLITTGDNADLLLMVFQDTGLTFILSLMLLSLSLLPIVAALFLIKEKDIAQAFLQLGLFGFSISLWSFSECNLTAFILPYPSLLYLLAFLGLFTCTIPLLKFGLCTLGLRKPWLLQVQIHLTQAAVMIAIVLQYTGIIGFAQSVYFFHILLPLSLSAFSLQILWATLKYKNPVARRFVIPMGILALAALLEVLNYKFRFTNNLSFFFQIGSVLFILSLAVLCIHFMQESLKMKEEKKQMEFDLLLAERQTEVQRHQYAILTEHEKVLREQRHDLRHQLIVLKSYSMENDQESLQNYIDELTAKIPVEKDLFLCRNFVVNSMALYFRSLAKKQQIDLTLQLAAIGEKNGPIQDSDLCVILGNLLENAIEASAYLPAEQRRITLTSRIYNKKLFILMDNSYDGFCSQKSGVFYSRKRADKGTGLASIETVASKYHGMVSFEPGDKNFVSSVYLELTEEYTVP